MSRRKKKSRGLYDEFISEYNRLKLTKLEPYVLADIIVQANRQRKREAAKWKHEATAYRKQFIRERDAHVRTQNNFRKYLDDCARREQTLRSREEDYMKWHNSVEELARKEAEKHVGDMIRFVGDVLTEIIVRLCVKGRKEGEGV